MDSWRQGGLLSPHGTGREQKGIVPVGGKACWGAVASNGGPVRAVTDQRYADQAELRSVPNVSGGSRGGRGLARHHYNPSWPRRCPHSTGTWPSRHTQKWLGRSPPTPFPTVVVLSWSYVLSVVVESSTPARPQILRSSAGSSRMTPWSARGITAPCASLTIH